MGVGGGFGIFDEDGFVVLVGEWTVDAVEIGTGIENEGAVVGFIELRAGREGWIETVAIAAREELLGGRMEEEEAVGTRVGADEDTFECFRAPFIFVMAPLFARLFQVSDGKEGK